MLYKSNSEFIVYQKEGDLYQSKLVHQDTKSQLYGELNGRLNNYVENFDQFLKFKTPTANGLLSVLTRGPIILNILAGRGYKNVLFVGYFDSAYKNWMLDLNSDKIVDVIPYESRNIPFVMDNNVSYQFMPIIHKEYGYNFNMTVVRPPEAKYRGALHYLYDRYDLNMVEANKQYKHGSTSFALNEIPEEPYDAVFFAGVPKKYDDTTFTSEEIKSLFAPYCKEGFEVFDIYYSDVDKLRFSDEENRNDITPQITKAFSTRAEWDKEVVTGRPIHFDVYNRCIKCY